MISIMIKIMLVEKTIMMIIMVVNRHHNIMSSLSCSNKSN